MSTIGERIKTARESKGYLQSDLARLIGVKSSGVISNWEKDLNKPDAEKIVKICEALNISVSFLLDYYGKTAFECTPSEQTFLEKYRALDDHGREHINTVLDWESQRTAALREAQQTTPSTIIEPHSLTNDGGRILEYYHSASAGDGIFILGNEHTEHITIPDTPENRKVDFAIGVSGDSMEPDYHDGDIVLVSQKAELFPGDVGIFIINSKAYTKEYGKQELISRNPDSENIKVSEYDNIVCMGKVVGKLKSGGIKNVQNCIF